MTGIQLKSNYSLRNSFAVYMYGSDGLPFIAPTETCVATILQVWRQSWFYKYGDKVVRRNNWI